MKKIRILLIIMLTLSSLICACGKHDDASDDFSAENTEEITLEETSAEQFRKGYDLSVDSGQREEAENDCKKAMELIRDIYGQADKGDASNVVLSDETVLKMQEKLKETEIPVVAGVTYSDMDNFESVDRFLLECMDGICGSVIVYEVYSSGGIGRKKFIFDGTDMYVLSTNAVWNTENEPQITYVSYTRIKEWRYTEKGWFCYELCVPEPPAVTEIIDGSHLLRVKPMGEDNRAISEKCLLGLGYQGNNLLSSNWNAEHMEKLDYNGLYEYLYAMKYHEKFNSGDYPDGIPKLEFESLIMEYLPVTAEQIRDYAVFDEEMQAYKWVRLGCFNYVPTYFETSVPEVTDIRENADGTITLTVDAVCEMILCDDAVITHELTIQMKEDGSFQYLGNKILNDGIRYIPEYQYRFNAKMTEEGLRSTDIGKPDSQEDTDTDENDIDLIDDIDTIEEINECMIPEQSFDITLDDWGEVKFVSCKPKKPVFCDYEASFFLIRNEQILYQFPYMNEHNKKDYTGCFYSIEAVAFRDINDDRKKDIIIIFHYISGAGRTGMVPRPKTRIFLAGENEFYLARDIMADVEKYILEEDMTIENICNFLTMKK